MHPLPLTTAMGAQHSLHRLVLILLPYTYPPFGYLFV